MILEQFNSAVREYCKELGVKDTRKRFIATIGGKNILYTKTTCVDGQEDWELAYQLGITPTLEGYIFAHVLDIPSQFEYEKWIIPTCIKETSGEISPTRIKEAATPEGTVLYNDSFIAYSIPKHTSNHEIGFLSKQEDGSWRGFGESERQEFIRWLINTKVIPV